MCIYNFSFTAFINRCLFVLSDNQGPVEPVQGLAVVLSEVALLEATFSTFLFATPQTTEGRHTRTPTNTHTSCCCLHPAKGISGFIIFLFLRGTEAETGVTPAHRSLRTRPPSSACVSVCFSAACRWSNKGRLSGGRDFLLPAAMRGARIFVEECAAFSRR